MNTGLVSKMKDEWNRRHSLEDEEENRTRGRIGSDGEWVKDDTGERGRGT